MRSIYIVCLFVHLEVGNVDLSCTWFHVEVTRIVVLCVAGMNQRNGTDVDAGNAMRVFKNLGYHVKLYNDQTVDQIMNVLTAGENDLNLPLLLVKLKISLMLLTLFTCFCYVSAVCVFIYPPLCFFLSIQGRSQQLSLFCLHSFESRG